jgi:hypothetical protein
MNGVRVRIQTTRECVVVKYGMYLFLGARPGDDETSRGLAGLGQAKQPRSEAKEKH